MLEASRRLARAEPLGADDQTALIPALLCRFHGQPEKTAWIR